jgi:hypothetical protein
MHRFLTSLFVLCIAAFSCAAQVVPVAPSSSDDTAAVQAAVNQICSTGKGQLYLQSGHFSILGNVTFPCGMKVTCDGIARTMITGAPGSTVFTMATADRFVIEDCQWAPPFGMAVYIPSDGVHNNIFSTFSRVWMSGCTIGCIKGTLWSGGRIENSVIAASGSGVGVSVAEGVQPIATGGITVLDSQISADDIAFICGDCAGTYLLDSGFTGRRPIQFVIMRSDGDARIMANVEGCTLVCVQFSQGAPGVNFGNVQIIASGIQANAEHGIYISAGDHAPWISGFSVTGSHVGGAAGGFGFFAEGVTRIAVTGSNIFGSATLGSTVSHGTWVGNTCDGGAISNSGVQVLIANNMGC